MAMPSPQEPILPTKADGLEQSAKSPADNRGMAYDALPGVI